MRYKLVVAYDGSDFYGYAKQPGFRTVQNTLEEKLSMIFNEEIKIFGSGRTDKGVHANGQVIHFDSEKEINLEKLKISLNKLLCDEIVIKTIELVDESFDSRFSAKTKIYKYVIAVGTLSPFERKYVAFVKSLDINKLKEASELFIGTKCFKNFCSKEEDELNFIRSIFEIDCIEKENHVYIVFKGNGFMRYQVRKMVGTMIAYEKGKISLKEINEFLTKSERDIISFTSSGSGLYLDEVLY